MTIVLIQSSEEIKSNERINMMTRDLGDLGCVQSIAFMWSLVQDLTRPSNMPKLSENQRWLLNGMLEAGQSVSETARTLNVARSVVRKWRDRRQQPGGSLKDLERSGRPRVTSANQDASILNKVEAKRTMTGECRFCLIIIPAFSSQTMFCLVICFVLFAMCCSSCLINPIFYRKPDS